MNYLGINTKHTKEISQELNILLSNYQIYYQNLRNFHWNVKGENFFELHEHFEDLYSDAREKIDAIAERILTLRSTPLSKFSDYIKYAEFRESEILDNDRDMVKYILNNHAAIITNMRRAINIANEYHDEGTIDLLGSALENIEKKSWMLDAWLAKVLDPILSQ